MTDMGYDSSALRASAAGHQESADAADEAANSYSRIQVTSAAFGRVAAAAGLSAALDVARQTEGRSAAAEMQARHDLAGRARVAADVGDALTAVTSGIAATVTAAGSVLAGMQG
jgi:hypothetical protein